MPDDIFHKFHALPQEVKNVLTSPESLEEQEALEEKYNIPLADLLMRVMVREISFASLPTHLREREHMDAGKADALMEELRENILGPALPYLEGGSQTVSPQAASQTVRPTLKNVAAAGTPRPAAPQTRPTTGVPPAPPQPAMSVPPLPPKPPSIPQTASGIPPVVPKPPIAPPVSLRPTVPAQTAPFLIDAHDEEDIAQHEKKLATLAGVPQTTSVEQRADTFLKKLNMTFATDVLAKRFRAIVLSRLHDVRDKLGTEEMLTKPAKIGGMELDHENAQRVAGELEREAARIHDEVQRLPPVLAAPKPAKEHRAEEPAIVPPFVREAARASAPPVLQPKQVAASTLASVAALQKQNIQRRPAPSAAPLLAVKPTVPLASIPQIPRIQQAVPPSRAPIPMAPQPAVPPTRSVPVQVIPPAVPASREQSVAPRQAMAQAGKQVVHDIRRPARPMSLIDELADMTVDDFRRLGDTLPESASKVVEKIHLLAEDSFAKRAEGIAAWRKNAINQLYLAMGRESIVTGKTIDEIIQAHERVHQATLTAQEFALVGDINRHLTI